MGVVVGAGLPVLEWWLKGRAAREAEVTDPVREGYRPFTVQHLHPNYLFFFPLDPQQRVALGNRYVTMTREGFRGPGPEAAQGRRLAFLVGGSVAFGHLASGDAGTITAALNRRQTNYFFVNAGVPSWNSSQELVRLALELKNYGPALVVALDGANDLKIGLDYRRRGQPFEPGYPESFHQLSALVDDIRSGSPAEPKGSWFKRTFPHVRDALNRLRKGARKPKVTGVDNTPASGMSASEVGGMARWLARNHGSMRDLVQGSGGKFLAVFQPVATLHAACPPRLKSADGANYTAFHQQVADHASGGPFLDLSRCFDPGKTSGPVPAEVFLDQVHLSDAGNDEVARQIIPALP